MSKSKESKNDLFDIYERFNPHHFEKENNSSETAQVKFCFNCGAFNPKFQYICGMCKSKNIKKVNKNNIKLIKRDLFES